MTSVLPLPVCGAANFLSQFKNLHNTTKICGFSTQIHLMHLHNLLPDFRFSCIFFLWSNSQYIFSQKKQRFEDFYWANIILFCRDRTLSYIYHSIIIYVHHTFAIANHAESTSALFVVSEYGRQKNNNLSKYCILYIIRVQVPRKFCLRLSGLSRRKQYILNMYYI